MLWAHKPDRASVTVVRPEIVVVGALELAIEIA